ncbi:MAG: alpha/beta hydrolase [Chloroflexi bacterium]|nr:alpha/beta hydrolase [Chloroflexota bacterium]
MLARACHVGRLALHVNRSTVGSRDTGATAGPITIQETALNYLDGTFPGKGGIEIYHQRWLPDGDPRAILLVAHGYGEHSGRYGNLVDFFVPRGFGIYALDHRGHGRSGGERVHVDSFDDYVDDLKSYSGLIRVAAADMPVYLLGHSMGVFIAVSYAARYQDELAGLILSGGGMGRRGPRPAGVKQPDLAATVSKDPAVVQAYRDDPLVFHGTPPASRRAAMADLAEAMPGRVRAVTLPVLIMAGGASPLGDGEGSQQIYDRVSSEDKTLELYDGLMHEIFNEPERDQVFADLLAWLEADHPSP